MALTVGAYLWPTQERAVAVTAVIAIVAVNPGGITRTAVLTRVVLGVATLGEEVVAPEVNIPKAIPRALIAVLGVYAVVAVTALAVVPVADLAATDVPCGSWSRPARSTRWPPSCAWAPPSPPSACC